MKKLLFILVFVVPTIVFAQSLHTDTTAVRAILNKNGLTSVAMSSVININTENRVDSLKLSGQNLHVIPREIGNITALYYLDLSNNNLKDLPAEIGNLTTVKRLDLRYNHLSYLPDEITAITPGIFGLQAQYNILCQVSDTVESWLDLHHPIWSGEQECAFPKFSSPEHVYIGVEDVFGYKATAYDAIGLGLTYAFSEANPSWLTVVGTDSLTGTPPSIGIDTAVCTLSTLGMTQDTLILEINIVAGTGILDIPLFMEPAAINISAAMLSNNQVHFSAYLDQPGDFSIRVYDVMGRMVWNHPVRNAAAGRYHTRWDLHDGRTVSTGMYIVNLVKENRQASGKFSILK